MSEALIYIIDDDSGMRLALERLFRSVDLRACAFESAAAFLADYRPDQPGCLISDVRLPGLNGLELQRRLSEMGSGLPVILMTGFGDIPMSVQAMKAGAVDFLPKPFRDQDMLDAAAAAIDRDRRNRADKGDLDQLRRLHAALTAREQQVMLGVAAGRMNKQIAGDLGLSEVTIKIHRGVMMKKMEAATAADLVRMAGRLGLSPSDPPH